MWRNFWGGPEVPVPNIGRVAATPIFGPKISNSANKVKTKHVGALLVATGLLCTRISFFLKLDKKWLSYEQYSYAHIWAQAPIRAVFCLKLRQISIFFNETTSIRSVGTKYMFWATAVSLPAKMWIWGLENLKSLISPFAKRANRISLKT